MTTKLNNLYKKFLSEKNKGHCKNSANVEEDVLSLFGNQDYIVEELKQRI